MDSGDSLTLRTESKPLNRSVFSFCRAQKRQPPSSRTVGSQQEVSGASLSILSSFYALGIILPGPSHYTMALYSPLLNTPSNLSIMEENSVKASSLRLARWTIPPNSVVITKAKVKHTSTETTTNNAPSLQVLCETITECRGALLDATAGLRSAPASSLKAAVPTCSATDYRCQAMLDERTRKTHQVITGSGPPFLCLSQERGAV